jgi:hypothetical protein
MPSALRTSWSFSGRGGSIAPSSRISSSFGGGGNGDITLFSRLWLRLLSGKVAPAGLGANNGESVYREKSEDTLPPDSSLE